MNDLQPGEEERVEDGATTEKRPWVTPVATVEQVSEVTKNLTGTGGDFVNCHS